MFKELFLWYYYLVGSGKALYIKLFRCIYSSLTLLYYNGGGTSE